MCCLAGSVSVALMTNTVVSVGCTRLFAGSEPGAVSARILAIVVEVETDVLTSATSASVPVLTDQRSTPHCAQAEPANIDRKSVV